MESKRVVNPIECHPARLLIVDDEPALLRAMRRVLEAAAPEWTVVCARDGAEALDQLARDHFDVVMLDLHMPVMDGLTLLRHLEPKYPKVRRIVHSSHIEPTGHALLNQLAHEVVAKPAHPGQILEALRRALGCDSNRREDDEACESGRREDDEARESGRREDDEARESGRREDDEACESGVQGSARGTPKTPGIVVA